LSKPARWFDRGRTVLWDAFPNFNVRPVAFTENERTVATEAVYTGTRKGAFNGFAPTDRSFELRIVVIFRFDAPDSPKKTNECIYLDYASQLRKLGLLPT